MNNHTTPRGAVRRRPRRRVQPIAAAPHQSRMTRPLAAVNDDRTSAITPIPVNTPTEPTDFRSLGVPDAIIDTLRRIGIQTPFPIQSATLPDSLAGRDV